jgi:hypothetical protein
MTDLNRAWSRVGAYGGTFLGRAITPLWGEEREITFSRASVTDDHGTFEAEGFGAAYWVTLGQVDSTDPTREQALPAGVTQRMLLRVFVRPPVDPALTPLVGDTFTWTDSGGTQRTNRITAVIDPSGVHSHYEIVSEAIT